MEAVTEDILAILSVALERDRQPCWRGRGTGPWWPVWCSLPVRIGYICPFVRGDVSVYVTFLLLKEYKLGFQ